MPYDTFNTYGGASAMHEDTATSKAAKKDADVAPGKIRFMVMSGFLGAGKTTTMIALGEHMNKTYGKVGIIANDLGANLVDTNLTQTSGCTVEEIAERVHLLPDGQHHRQDSPPARPRWRHLRHERHPRAGRRCARSRLPSSRGRLRGLDHAVTVHGARRSRAHQAAAAEGEDINLPEEIKYLMQLQLEEADLIVLNKIDVMTPEEVERDVAFLREACPDIPVMTISALRGDGIPELAEYLETHESLLKNFSVRDNEKFQEAEKTLTWYNRRLFFKQLDDEKIDCNAVIDDLIEEIRMGLIEKKRNVPHLKTFATAGAGDFNKCSLLGIDYDIEHTQPFLRKHKKMSMIINARAVCESRPFARIVDDAVDFVCDKYNLDAQVFFTECFNMGDEGR